MREFPLPVLTRVIHHLALSIHVPMDDPHEVNNLLKCTRLWLYSCDSYYRASLVCWDQQCAPDSGAVFHHSEPDSKMCLTHCCRTWGLVSSKCLPSECHLHFFFFFWQRSERGHKPVSLETVQSFEVGACDDAKNSISYYDGSPVLIF